MVAFATFMATILAYGLVNVFVWDRPALLGSTGGVATKAVGSAGTWREMLGYVWQDYFPRLPFMRDAFPVDFPPWHRWFLDLSGRFGWGDYEIPRPAAKVAAIVVLCLLIVAALDVLVRRRRAARNAWREWFTYLTMCAGLMFLLGYTGYGYAKVTGYGFEQGRYLLPLAALYAVVLALAFRALGSRAGPIAAVSVVVGTMLLNVCGMVVTVARFYA